MAAKYDDFAPEIFGSPEEEAAFDALFADGASPDLTGWSDETVELADADELAEITSLIAGMGEVHASAELNERTLASILGDADDDADSGAPSDVTATLVMPKADASSINPSAEGAKDLQPIGQESLSRPSRTARPRRRLGARWAVIAAVVLALIGSVAYAVPATYVEVGSDAASITLGVNVFGLTVSAVAEGEDAEAVLEELSLQNKGYEDSLREIAVGFAERAVGQGSEPQLNVEVVGGWMAPMRGGVEQGAQRVLDDSSMLATTPSQPQAGQQAPAQSDADPTEPERQPDAAQQPSNQGQPAAPPSEQQPATPSAPSQQPSAPSQPQSQSDQPSAPAQQQPSQPEQSSPGQPSQQQPAEPQQAPPAEQPQAQQQPAAPEQGTGQQPLGQQNAPQPINPESAPEFEAQATHSQPDSLQPNSPQPNPSAQPSAEARDSSSESQKAAEYRPDIDGVQ